MSKIERDIRRASREQVVKLAKFYKKNEEEFLVAWLSDKLVYHLSGEKHGSKALMAAEAKMSYFTMGKGSRQKIIQLLKQFFKKEKRVSKAWIFGSFSREEDKPGSDIDIMIEMPKEKAFTLFDLADIQHRLSELVNRKVDLVEKDAIKPFAMETARKDMQLIYG